MKRSLATASPKQHYRILVIGGGSGGMAVTSQISAHHLASVRTASAATPLGIIDPSPTHFYQPLWTLVGGGLNKMSASQRPMRQVIDAANAPSAQTPIAWHQKSVVQINPREQRVALDDGSSIAYDYLVISSGFKLDLDRIPGLKAALDDPHVPVTSNYVRESVEKTARLIKEFQGGTAIFTQPSTPIKCAGAPQKIMYLAEEAWKRAKLREPGQSRIIFKTGMGKIFAVDKYATALRQICQDRGIQVDYQDELVEIDGGNRKARFLNAQTKQDEWLDFDFMHVTPHMKPHEYLAKSEGIANDAGFVMVDARHLQHTKYPNIFALGDCAALPVSKTASAVAAQSNVVVNNLIRQLQQDTLNSAPDTKFSQLIAQPIDYDGYTACPLVTSSTTLIMAEFNGFTLEPCETFWFDQSKPSTAMYTVKANLLPSIYWDLMLKGQWIGPQPYRKLLNPLNRN